VRPAAEDASDARSLAGIVTRGLAATVDLLVTLAATGLAYLGYSAIRFVLQPRSFRAPQPSAAVAGAAWIAIAVAYLTVGWVITGRSIGAQLLGLRVVSRSGGGLRTSLAVVRAFLCVVFPIGLLWSSVSRRRASAQDLLLGTRVVYDWEIHTSRVTARSGSGLEAGASAPGG